MVVHDHVTNHCDLNFFSDGGSDSSVSDGLPVHLQYMADKVNE